MYHAPKMLRHSKRQSFVVYHCLSLSQKPVPRRDFLLPLNVHLGVKVKFHKQENLIFSHAEKKPYNIGEIGYLSKLIA